VAKRVDQGEADTQEIEELARGAGYDVVDTITQTRTEDGALQFGEGKVEELARRLRTRTAETVIFDNRLGPYQTYNLGQKLPDGVAVMDRFTLILELFGQRAQTRKAQLQVELAELRYELPRAEAKVSLARREERPGFMGLGEYDESREKDIEAQISAIREELSRIEKTEAQRREQRRESGFELLALAGYTNAGKSTLMQSLASDLELGENAELHPDLETTAEAQDRLFTTLGTTTRRMEMDGRNALLTDTVGFISDLPHWLVESFYSTLESVYQADLVLLVVDVSEPLEEIQAKLLTCHDTLYERNEAPILTVFNKIDAISETELEAKLEELDALTEATVSVSAAEGLHLDELRETIDSVLPPQKRERLVLPLAGDSMSVVSWVHDHAVVNEVDYGAEELVIDFKARPAIVEQTRAKANEVVES